jgi:hypothetical protein
MLHFQRGALDPRRFWHDVPEAFGQKTETDLFIGRDAHEILVRLGLAEIAVDYVVVDTVRVPRETFASIITAWRDGYVDPIVEYTTLSREDATAYFDQMIDDIHDPAKYAVWMVPVVSARVP